MLLRSSLDYTAHLLAGAVFGALAAAAAASVLAKRRDGSTASIDPTSELPSGSGTAQGGID